MGEVSDGLGDELMDRLDEEPSMDLRAQLSAIAWIATDDRYHETASRHLLMRGKSLEAR